MDIATRHVFMTNSAVYVKSYILPHGGKFTRNNFHATVTNSLVVHFYIASDPQQILYR